LIYVVEPHLQRAWNSKLRGLLECLSGKCGVLLTRESDLPGFESWCESQSVKVNSVVFDPYKLSTDDAVLLDCRVKFNQEQLVKLKKTKVKIIVSANHFFLPEKTVLDLVQNSASESKLSIIVENQASLPHLLECWGIDAFAPSIILIPPILDSRNDLERFSLLLSKPEQTRRISDRKILHAGVIMYHRPRGRWWQKKFGVLEYYPARTLIHDNAAKLEITNLSKVVEDNSRRDKWGNNIKRRLEIILGIQKRRYNAYYSVNLPREFANHLFFICPEDIFEVVPQIGFQAMRSGMVLIGSSSAAYQSLGFSEGVNYLSVGHKWSLESVEIVIRKAKALESSKIEVMVERSQLLLSHIESVAAATINELCEGPKSE
jgi:hypothetical protein